MPLTDRDAVDQARLLRSFQVAERRPLDKVRRYWKGQQGPLAVIPSSAPSEVREMARIARVNVCDIVVESLAQSLFVDGFRGARDSDNHAVWEAWQANKFDRRQSGVHRAGLAYGASYTVVLPGDRAPVMRGVSPRAMTALYGEDPDWPLWALERTGAGTFRMYDDEAVYFLGEPRPPQPYRQYDEVPLVQIETREHGMGVCPVVRYLDEEDLDADDEVPEAADSVVMGQVAPLMTLQDQIDMTTFGLLVAQHYSAFRQRAAIGWVAESEAQKMNAAASQLWTFDEHPDEMRLQEFEQTNLDGYLKSREATMQYAATLSQTPVHELTGQLVNLSAEALAAAEAGRDRKVDERKTGMGESHEQALQLVGRLMGVEMPDDSQVIWRDTSARAFSATVDGLGKLAQMLGVPPQELWERIPNTTQKDLERWKAAAEAPDAIEELSRLLDRQAPAS